jgi:hypothetical protein
LISGTRSKYPTIPYGALIEADGQHAFVFVPEGANRVRKVPIRLGVFDHKSVQVVGGLEGVKEVVVSNSAFLSERSLIQITQ